jgi:hypothetical protein
VTVANLLDRLSLIYNELSTGSGEADEARGITALDMAQDYAEAVIATQGFVLQTTGTTTTTANTESSAYPTNCRRIDSVWLLDSNSLPYYELEASHGPGEHAVNLNWPASVTLSASPGSPARFSYDSASLYWTPVPDAVYTVRVYGYYAKADLSARTDTFNLPDIFSMPLVAFAARLIKIGVDDPSQDLQGLADEMFLPVIRGLRTPVRGARPRHYTQVHVT